MPKFGNTLQALPTAPDYCPLLGHDVRHVEHQVIIGGVVSAIGGRAIMSTIVTGIGVIARCYSGKTRRQRRIRDKCRASGRPDVRRRQVPTRPVWLTIAVVIIHRFNRSLNEVVTVISWIRCRATWIPKLHLQ